MRAASSRGRTRAQARVEAVGERLWKKMGRRCWVQVVREEQAGGDHETRPVLLVITLLCDVLCMTNGSDSYCFSVASCTIVIPACRHTYLDEKCDCR